MKKQLILGLAMLGLLTSCGDDDSTPATNSNSAAIAEIVNIARTGSWVVSSYIDSGNDETNHFTGYTFTFGLTGSVTATGNGNTYNGTWSVTDDGSDDDDNSSGDIDFNIAFSSPADFAELTEDWDIIERSNSVIRLRHVSGGNGGTDNLVFTKIQ